MSSSGVSPNKMKKVGGTRESGRADDRSHDEELQETLVGLLSCQWEIDSVDDKWIAEILMVDRKYNKLKQPYREVQKEAIKRIPNFWVTAFVNHPQLSTILEGDEIDCLRFLSKLEVEDFEDIESGYMITFHFDDNPYFLNDVLTKEFHFDLSQNTEIQWKEGKSLTKNAEGKNVGKGKERPTQPMSFFDWFTSNGDTVDIAEMIKDQLWANPLKYFLKSKTNSENVLRMEARKRKM